MTRFFHLYNIIILIITIQYLHSIFYNIPNARVERIKMTTYFVTPPRIILHIKVRRSAKRNRKKLIIGITRNTRVIEWNAF
jgi:hypothetical protein